MTTTRFAPSPTGYLHLGHAYSALFAAEQAAGGRVLLRIEDIDRGRCRPEFERAILEDLAWLGVAWEAPVRRQSEHMDNYRQALDRLAEQGLLYPCFCTRKDIQQEIAAAAGAPHGPDGPLYPGTCRRLPESARADRIDRGDAFALRLDIAGAADAAGPLAWRDIDRGEQTARPEIFGDVVLARKDVPTSYHLAVTVDDALQERDAGDPRRGPVRGHAMCTGCCRPCWTCPCPCGAITRSSPARTAGGSPSATAPKPCARSGTPAKRPTTFGQGSPPWSNNPDKS